MFAVRKFFYSTRFKLLKGDDLDDYGFEEDVIGVGRDGGDLCMYMYLDIVI